MLTQFQAMFIRQLCMPKAEKGGRCGGGCQKNEILRVRGGERYLKGSIRGKRDEVLPIFTFILTLTHLQHLL